MRRRGMRLRRMGGSGVGRRAWPGAVLAAAALALPREALACATCFGDPGAPETRGLNLAILTLLGVVGLVQVGIGKVIWDVRKRSKRLGEPTELRVIRGGK